MARWKHIEIVKIIVDGVEVDAKKCTKCGEVKALTEFGDDNRTSTGKKSACRNCYNKEYRRYRRSNLAKVARLRRLAYHRCPQYQLEYNVEYRRRHPERKKLHDGVRNARKRALPGTSICLRRLEPICSLTGESSDVTLEHWLPFETGHGGTYIGNIYYLTGHLNYSKQNKNPFEWFEANGQRFELSQSAFNELVAKLAAQNGLTPEEFRDFTYWCFANKRSVEQVRADNLRYGYKKPSLEIWREETGLAFPIRVDFDDLSLDHAQETEEANAA